MQVTNWANSRIQGRCKAGAVRATLRPRVDPDRLSRGRGTRAEYGRRSRGLDPAGIRGVGRFPIGSNRRNRSAAQSTARVRVLPGDMTTASTGETYPLVFLVFNSIFNLLTQDDQVRCFENAARHLTGDGLFLIEAAVPSAWTQHDQYVNAERVGVDHVVFDVCRYDPVTQILDETTFTSTRPVSAWDPFPAGSPGQPNWTSWPGWPDYA